MLYAVVFSTSKFGASVPRFQWWDEANIEFVLSSSLVTSVAPPTLGKWHGRADEHPALQGKPRLLGRQPPAVSYRKPLQATVLLKPYNEVQFILSRRQNFLPWLKNFYRTCHLPIPSALSLKMLSLSSPHVHLMLPLAPGPLHMLFLLLENPCHSLSLVFYYLPFRPLLKHHFIKNFLDIPD